MSEILNVWVFTSACWPGFLGHPKWNPLLHLIQYHFFYAIPEHLNRKCFRLYFHFKLSGDIHSRCFPSHTKHFIYIHKQNIFCVCEHARVCGAFWRCIVMMPYSFIVPGCQSSAGDWHTHSIRERQAIFQCQDGTFTLPPDWSHTCVLIILHLHFSI